MLARKARAEGRTRSSVGHCHVCGAQDAFRLIPSFSRLRRVTSDCKPWEAGGSLGVCDVCTAVLKPIDAKWRAEAHQIYEDYSIYHQGGGNEPTIYVGNFEQLLKRSTQLFRNALADLDLKTRGRLLDVGCGNGAALRTIAPLLPNWTFEAHEIDDKYRAEIEAIPGIAKFHVGPISPNVGRYDLIMLVHVLEHVANPSGFLTRLANILAPDGVLLMVVPNIETNPFDLLVADHCSHFSRSSLWTLLRRSGIDAAQVNDWWMIRQLTALGRHGSRPAVAAPPPERTDIAAMVDWLLELRGDALLRARHRPFGIFGSSISAVWLAGELGSKFDFFVDEDQSRVGRTLLDRPILAPESVPAAAQVYVAMPYPWCEEIANRLSDRGASYLTPPVP